MLAIHAAASARKYCSEKGLDAGRAMRQFVKLAMGPAIVAIICGSAFAQDTLQQDFLAPPVNAKPVVWWFWGETVITDHGITQDLEALKRVGFGGVVIYEQVFTDRPGTLKSLSPEWLEKVRFAAAECARLGMTLEVNSGDGYVAGGPWITPALGMQRLVASQVEVDGGKAYVASARSATDDAKNATSSNGPWVSVANATNVKHPSCSPSFSNWRCRK